MKINIFPTIAAVLLAVSGTTLAGGDGRREDSLALRLTGDRTARKIGDLLTVIIEEKSSAKVDGRKSTDRAYNESGGATFSAPLIDSRSTEKWTNAVLPDFKVKGDSTFSGKGSSENNGNLSGAITVRVMDTLPGGIMLVEGKRTLFVQDEMLTYVLSGTVRPEDIKADNTIMSSQIGDMTVRYQSSGSIARSQRKGLFGSLAEWINPF